MTWYQFEELVTSKRFKSFYWRFGAYLVVSGGAWILNNLQLLDLSPLMVALISFIIGEITKKINNIVFLKNE